MQRFHTITPLLLILVFVLAGCAGAKKTARAPHPLAGTWEYSLDTPQGVYTGTMMFVEAEGVLSGTITSDDQPDQAAPLEDLAFNTEMSEVSFKFDGGEYGNMRVLSMLEGDAMKGSMNVGAYNVDVPLTASKKMP